VGDLKQSIMEIVVCIKQVPATTRVRLDPNTRTIIREGVELMLNPFDAYALEEALRLRERHGGQVSVLSMGIPSAVHLLREALAMGADRGILLTDRHFAGADTLATAYTLAAAIRKLGRFDLIYAVGKPLMEIRPKWDLNWRRSWVFLT